MATAKKEPVPQKAGSVQFSGMVRAIRPCFIANVYRREGDVFHYEGWYSERCAFRPVEDENLRSRPGGPVEGAPDPLEAKE